jgi:hypothetical protein
MVEARLPGAEPLQKAEQRSTAMRKILITSAIVGLLASPAFAHCDSMDGPVVHDAQQAIAEENVTPVLKWVTEEDENEVRSAFAMTLAVRGESDAAREIADRYFYETLIRVHRASEGEGFTGLKPAGSVDPAIAAADKALENGEIEPLAGELASSVRNGVEQRFAEAYEKRQTAGESVAQGREYVAAYVQFTHYAENVHNMAKAGPDHQHGETLAGH